LGSELKNLAVDHYEAGYRRDPKAEDHGLLRFAGKQKHPAGDRGRGDSEDDRLQDA
jgi:hypothetical protein